MRIISTLLCATILSAHLFGQVYSDYLGAGHDQDIIVLSSSNQGRATGEKTISADGMDADLMEAARFLGQTTLGFDMAMIENFVGTDYGTWIDDQIAIPASNLTDITENVWNTVYNLQVSQGDDPNDIFGPYQLHFNYGWWTMSMTEQDLLRQRIAFALSQIYVTSGNSDLRDRAEGMANYYDVLLNNAFGNFEDLLLEITLHPSMGYYLSHLNNPKSDPANNVHPDENYAREIMQLFSIGLYELNLDGSLQLDNNGDPIPTYDNNDIKEFAKVFTGLGAGAVSHNVDWTDDPYFGLGIWGTDLTTPMQMYEPFHEPGQKFLLNGYTIPSGQTGMTDIQQAVTHLFNHSNVGPFLAIRMIQRLVTSNPTPEYVSRVATVFNDNGQGVRGDMAAVVKAILLDQEARGAAAMMQNSHGRLKEPLIRELHIAKSLPHDNPFGRYWNNGYDISDDLKQWTLDAPSVFNFYTFDHSPVGPINNLGLVAPEYKIHNTSTSIQYVNYVNRWVVNQNLWWSWHGNYGDQSVTLNTDSVEDLASNPEEMINYFDILYCYGQLSDETRKILRENAVQFNNNDYNRTRIIMYLLLLSSDFTITK